MKVLIAGGAGFTGSHIVEYFQGKVDVVVLDNFRTGFRENLAGLNCTIIKGSVTDPSAVKEAVEGVDFVFPLAAMISVLESMAKLRQCVEINTQGTLIVLEEAARSGVQKLCFSSSAAVSGDNSPVAQDRGHAARAEESLCGDQARWRVLLPDLPGGRLASNRLYAVF